ncbi:uncharacterized protein MYCGRDRAFT_107566 [Zymoseptoria tritici IPO323]|uniref:Glycosyl transferase 64 domain-containing protein n=1 Tax=Zymoseptoria tritici (strain CBS 115943 / IPO323) TaxID=336722 RepID=F9WWW1_ZYMTI|nr:uncharacterized protein MYCGRDRAFT_107566 [Zymoseptoria tritici IPO323]EGP92052.1 hypothetical protein MYCGRDRAFT_107566 [Zymoseptoria tritici IPO323]
MARDKRLIIGATLLVLILTFTLIAQLADESQLKPLSQLTRFYGGSGSAHEPIGPSDGLESVLGNITPAEEDGFTLIAPSWKRLDTLPDWIKHYASGDIPSLRRMIIIWPKVQGDAPTSLLDNVTQSNYPIPVIIDQREVNTLNGRFLKIDAIKTNSVLAMDDDMLYDPKDVEFGYQVWREFGQRERMSGFIARATNKDNTAYNIGGLKSYSMILTKSAWFHTDWMHAYWSQDERMTRLRKYVDDHMNCEDILMAFIHAHHTRKSPLYVKPYKMVDTGMKDGISAAGDHLKHRAACVSKFAEEFGQDTLVSSDAVFQRMLDNYG